MKWAYSGFDKAGAPTRGSVDVAGAEDAREALRRRGVFVTELKESDTAGGGTPAPGRAGPMFGKTRRLKELSLMTRQLSVLVSTGTPLVEAMTVLEKQAPVGPWRSVLTDVRRRVEEGATLSGAMEAHPGWFDAVCRSLVAAGESRGKLADMLLRLASLTRQQLKVRTAITGAMVYPCLLIFVAVGVLGLMIGFVMPRFEGLFHQLGAPLPPSTQMLMSAAAFAREKWYLLGIGATVVVTGAVVFLRSGAGVRAWDTMMVRAPQLGKVGRAFATARIARVLGVLLEGKVALLDALRLTRDATGNVLYAELMLKAEDAVTRGDSVSTAFEGSGLVSPSVVEALRSGERTGQVAPVLLTIADFLDEDNEVVVKTLTSIIEPIILVVLGLVVGLVAISMFLPLFDLTASAGGGGAS